MAILPPIKDVNQMAYFIGYRISDIKNVCNNINDYYYEYQIVKYDKDGKPKMKNGKVEKRITMPSKDKLKDMQDNLKKHVFSKIEYPTHIHGSVKKRSNITNAIAHKGKKYKFRTDIKGFFDNITPKMVYQMFIEQGFNSGIAHYLTKITTFKGKVPQGTSTSSDIANLVFLKIDALLLEFCKKHDITYTRYVDDLTFSSPKDFKDKKLEIISFITENGFKISHKKTNYNSLSSVTGLIVGNNSIDVPTEYKEKMKSCENKTKEQIVGLWQYYYNVRKTNSPKMIK